MLMLGFHTIGAGQQGDINELAVWETNSSFDVHYHEEKLFVSTDDNIQIFDVSDPSAPEEISTVNAPGFAMTLNVKGDYLYAGGGMETYFMIVDISDIDVPERSALIENVSGTGYQISIKEDYAFMPTNSDELYVFDITDKSSPHISDRIDVESFASGVAVKENYAYVGTRNGLALIDITQPGDAEKIEMVGSQDYGSISADFEGERLFIQRGDQGFDVVDISEPAGPSVNFGETSIPTSGELVFRMGHVFQIGNSEVGAYHVSSDEVEQVATYDNSITGQVQSVDAKDSVFFVATTNELLALSLDSPHQPLGIDSPLPVHSLKFYPNPAEDFLLVEGDKVDPRSELFIHNNQGTEVRSITPDNYGEVEIDISELAPGYYYLLLQDGEYISRVKFLKR